MNTHYRHAFVALALVACDGSVTTALELTDRSRFAAAGGLWDQGFQQAVARSELGNINTVSIGSCLYPGACPAGMSCSPCPTGPSTYSRSNFFSTVWPAPTTSYWVVDHNNDTGALALSFNSCNSGPPDQSLPVTNGTSGATVFNFYIGQGSTGRRAHLRLRNQYNPCTNGIPYLAIGAHKLRGNGKDVGSFVRNNSGTTGFTADVSTVTFKAAITQCQSAPCLFYFNIHARYNGKPRLLVLTIGHINHPGSHAKHAHWSWPVKQSYFYSGYDIVYLRCAESGVPCLNVSSAGTSYKLSMSKLLATASPLFDDPIAVGTQVAIEGVSWALETAGSAADAAGWVEGMRVDGATAPPSGNSCQGHCGGKSSTCWCDSLCTGYGDCCPDYASVCTGASPPPASPPVLSFSSGYNGNSTSVTLSPAQTLYGKVTGLASSNAQSCLEIVGRPITQQNGDGWCNNLSHWTTMTSSSAAGSWSYQGGVWRLTVSPVGSMFPAGAYRGLWRNTTTGQKAVAYFTVQNSASSPPMQPKTTGTKSPIGWLDGVSGGVASGWACDPDSPDSSIGVHVYVGGPAGSGAKVHYVQAKLANEGPVTTACGGGTAHRFKLEIPGWTASHGKPVYAYGLDVTSNPNALLSGSPKVLP